jgi:hypothetical protein
MAFFSSVRSSKISKYLGLTRLGFLGGSGLSSRRGDIMKTKYQTENTKRPRGIIVPYGLSVPVPPRDGNS